MAYLQHDDDDVWSGSALSADIAKQRMAQRQQEAATPSALDRALGGVKGTLSGAAGGAALGSAIGGPGVGTAIGAVSGALAGGAAGAASAQPSQQTPGLGESIAGAGGLAKTLKEDWGKYKAASALEELKKNPLEDISDADLAP